MGVPLEEVIRKLNAGGSLDDFTDEELAPESPEPEDGEEGTATVVFRPGQGSLPAPKS